MMLLGTRCEKFKKVRTVNATDTSFPSKVPTGTEPTGSGSSASAASVINLEGDGQCQNGLIVLPYAIGDDDDVFDMRVIGWRCVGNDPLYAIWIPVVLAQVTCTISTCVGVAGKEVLNTERFADTITLVTGNANVSIDITSPTGNVAAHFVMDVKGFQKVEFTFDMTTGNPDSANALYSLL